jgi:hypothetical protein
MPKAAGDCNNRTTAAANRPFAAFSHRTPRAARKEPDRTARITPWITKRGFGAQAEPVEQLYWSAALRQNAPAVTARHSAEWRRL